MKKTAFCIMALGLSLTFHPLVSNAAVDPVTSSKGIPDAVYVAG